MRQQLQPAVARRQGETSDATAETVLLRQAIKEHGYHDYFVWLLSG